QTRDTATNIAACDGIPLVAKFLMHQLREQFGRTQRLHPAGEGGSIRKAETRQRRHNHVERILGVAAKARRIGEHRDDFGETIEGIRPAVNQQQWRWIRSSAPYMDEVDAASVDVGMKVCKLVELRLLSTPIVLGLPVINQFLQGA